MPEKLSYKTLESIDYTGYLKKSAPVKALQIGDFSARSSITFSTVPMNGQTGTAKLRSSRRRRTAGPVCSMSRTVFIPCIFEEMRMGRL